MKTQMIVVAFLAVVFCILEHSPIAEANALSPNQNAPSPAPQPESPREQPFQLIKEKDCLTAKELVGKWIPDKELTEKIDGKISYDFDGINDQCEELIITDMPPDQAKLEKFLKWSCDEFESHKPSLDELPEHKRADVERKFNDSKRAMQNLYFAGSLEVHAKDQKRKTFPIVYATMWGSNALVFFFENDAGFQKSSVVFTLVRDPDGDKDMLFVGGRDLRSRYTAFVRKPEKKEE